MKSAFVIRHVAFEDLGTFGLVLESLNYRVTRHDAGRAPLPIRDAALADLLIVLGGPIGVYESGVYPCIAEEIEAVRQRLAADAPTLGICLGSQIMAAAMSARVYPGRAGKEIGWSALKLTDAGALGALAEIGPEKTSVLHWHGDTFDLPPHARLLASSGQYLHQAFSVGRALALQFHPEVAAAELETWFIGHTLELSSSPGISVAQLRADTARHAPALAVCGPRFFKRWLSEVSA